MKKVYTLFLIVLCSSFSYAQDPELFEQEWFLHYIVIDEATINSPMPEIDIFLDFNNSNEEVDYLEVHIPYCEDGHAGVINFEEDSVFNLETFDWVLLGVCNGEEFADFAEYMMNHYTVYALNNGSGTPKNPFIYTLETDGENYTLTIENIDGDYAVYSDQKLSTHEFENNAASVYPNPVSETLHIVGNKDVIRASIYSITGQKTTILNSIVKEIDVRLLQNGLYFLELEASDGSNQVVRFVKE